MKKVLILLFVLFSLKGYSQTVISAADVANHIGDSVTVCEKVYGARFLERTSITVLTLGREFPYQLLTLVIKGADRDKFKAKPEDLFLNRRICVSGKIGEYGGKPQIVVTDPNQIRLQ